MAKSNDELIQKYNGFINVEYEVDFLNPYPREEKVAKTFSVKVHFDMQTKGFAQATAKLRNALSPAVTIKLFEQAVLRSVVVNIRRRFLQSINKALEMKVVKENGHDTRTSPRERFNDVKLKNSLQRTFDHLNEAQMAGDSDRAFALRSKLVEKTDELHKSLQRSRHGKNLDSHRLSTIAGNRFRRSLIALMGLLTDSKLVEGKLVGSTLVVGIGNKAFLNQIETPSATSALRGSATSSKYRSFWRQVEFGSGARRSTMKDRVNLPTGPAQQWWYGRRQKHSMLLDGTAPMSFLTTNSGTMYTEDLRALAQEITKALNALLQGEQSA